MTSTRIPVGTWITVAVLGLFALLGGPAIGTVANTAPAGWVDVVDAPTGVTVALPGAAEATDVPFGRAYLPAGDEVAFAVVDVPTLPGIGLATVLDTLAPRFGATVVESTETTVDGRDALDAVITVDNDQAQGTALVRAIVDDGHVVVLVTRAADAADAQAQALHQQLISGARLA